MWPKLHATLARPMRLWPLCCALLIGCGAGEAGPVARLRLASDGQGELFEAPAPEAPRAVFASRFETELEGWRAIVSPGREPGGLEARVETQESRAVLHLTGRHGGMLSVLPVEPDTC